MLMLRPDIAYRPTGCTCPHSYGSLGRLYGIGMGSGWLRKGTTPDCPVHDACRGYSAAVRASRPWWSTPWCPRHGTRDCPASEGLDT